MGKTRQTANLASNIIVSSSNIGIGSASPKSKLDVSGNAKVSGITTTEGLNVGTSGTTITTTTSGLVGINSTSPKANLDVVGVVSATSYYEDGQLLINKIKSTAIGITLIFG